MTLDDGASGPASGDAEAEEGAGRSTPRPAPLHPHVARRGALGAVAMTLVVAAGVSFAFHPARAGQVSALLVLASIDAVLGGLALWRLARRGELARWFSPRGGDVTLGAVVAVALYGVATLFHAALLTRGEPREAWLVHVYLQLGDPAVLERHALLLGGALLLVAALEEIAWRGLAMPMLEPLLGARGALLAGAALYAAAHLPAAYLLRDAHAGLNPLVPLAALAGGLAWGATVRAAGRLTPAVISHMFFTWGVVQFPLWRP